MSDLSEAIEAQRARSRQSRMTRKARLNARRGRSRPGGFAVGCGCRFVRTGDAWRHIWPCKGHRLGGPLSDEQMFSLLGPA